MKSELIRAQAHSIALKIKYISWLPTVTIAKSTHLDVPLMKALFLLTIEKQKN